MDRSRKLGTCCRRGDSVDNDGERLGAVVVHCFRSWTQTVALNLAARIRSFGSDEFCLKAQSAELKTANVAVVVACRVLRLFRLV
jgi:hypothetical protein